MRLTHRCRALTNEPESLPRIEKIFILFIEKILYINEFFRLIPLIQVGFKWLSAGESGLYSHAL